MSRRRSQCDKIASYLKSHRSITPAEAMQYFGCNRLSARIWELRDRGMDIKTEMATKSRMDIETGKSYTVQYAVYSLEGES